MNRDPLPVRITLIVLAFLVMAILIGLPLITVFAQALAKGWDEYILALIDKITLSAIRLTLITALISVSVNLVFGVMAAWAIAKYEFKGKSFLLTLIDLPFSVSPVIAGLVFVLMFGLQGWLGPTLQGTGIKVIFALPGIVQCARHGRVRRRFGRLGPYPRQDQHHAAACRNPL
jgi:sulfate transport system permease protein